jgi:NAD(P)-dependent dehydrogenase (short-subunit alcohol dehydrogenase family)
MIFGWLRGVASQRSDFRGKVAIVTGAGSGIGRSTALLLARLGAKVHVVDVDGERAAAVVAEIERAGGRAEPHTVDVTDADAVAKLAAAAYAADGRVDVLHNNAGIGGYGPVEATPLEDWRRIVEVNLMGVVHGIHHFVPRMLRQGGGGHIVNTASGLGLFAAPEMAPYVTTKYAVVGLSESLNAELSKRNVYVTALCPGGTKTRIFEETASMVRGARAEDSRRAITRSADRFGTNPDVVARAVIDAIRRRKLIRTAPRLHVMPIWMIRRVSPRLAQGLGRVAIRVAYGAPGSHGGA